MHSAGRAHYGNPDLQFEIEYLIYDAEDKSTRVRVTRKSEERRRPAVVIHKHVDDEWLSCDLQAQSTIALLPRKIVGYTSGDNETLSLPFLISRSGYADAVARKALTAPTDDTLVHDTRLMLIDYSTNLEVLIANLLLGSARQTAALLDDIRVRKLHSFRCVIQLAHPAAPKAPPRRSQARRKGIQLTPELEQYLDYMRRCATCYDYEDKTEKYTFDFWVNEETHKAFATF